MASQTQSSFNTAADKVVKLTEWQGRVDRLFKEDFSILDRVLLYLVELPGSPLAKSMSLQGVPTEGLYREHSSDLTIRPIQETGYMDARFLKGWFDAKASAGLTASFTAKVNAVAQRAFDECEDHNDSSKSQHPKKSLKQMW